MKKTILFIAIIGSLSSFVLRTTSSSLSDKQLSNLCAFIPSGKAKLGEHFTSVQSFIMFKTEVTNYQYQEFLTDLKANGTQEKLQIAQIDSCNWNTSDGKNETMSKYYHQHPAYQNHPVVNISYEAALLYCDWLTQKMQKTGTISSEQHFRLPTKAEFIRATRGDNHNQIYSWPNSTLFNEKGKDQCNYFKINAENIHYNSEANQYELKDINLTYKYKSYTTNAKSFTPNEFEIYNLNGNVSEMIAEKGIALGGNYASTGYDVRNESQISFESSSNKVGFRPVLTFLPK
jgi:formylglycine-generating enzyme required for sulfatase activity